MTAAWYRRTLRWAQTNLTEKDPARYDADWWRDQWRRTRVQGVIVNAGGIVAYYPSKFPLQHRAAFLEDRDLYGEIVAAARSEGLVVLARMDSNRAHQSFYDAHPDWFAIDAEGNPYRAGELYVACVNSPYYKEFLPTVLEEIIERSAPEGITDNSWSGLDRDHICYCEHCRRGFTEDLPKRADWADPAYRRWILWSYQTRLAVWDLNNSVTRRVGGPDCLWIGMNGGEVVAQSKRLRDDVEICRRASIFLLDSQWRHDETGFQANADSGKRLHGLLGWDTLIPESTAMYDAGTPTFRLGSKPEPEARMWAVEGFAGGIQPWWHHIGSVHEDRRQYATAEPLFRWHSEHESYLIDREPVATVGLLWSQRSVDFHGKDRPETAMLPYRGFVDALIRARIPYVPVHADHVAESACAVIVVPNVGVLTDSQCAALRAFASGGRGLVVTGESSLYDEWGDRRADFALADLLGVHHTGERRGVTGSAASWETFDGHSYLRIEDRAIADGLGDTDLVPFGGQLQVVRSDRAALTFVPPFPIYPPEKSWMVEPRTDVPALVLRDRTAYLAADLDRLYASYHHPDHGRVLANLVRWAAAGEIPLEVAGTGVLDCQLYRQGDALIVHLVNLDQGGAWRGRLEELTPVGPFTVRVKGTGRAAAFLVGGGEVEVSSTDGWTTVEVGRITDHEVVVIS
ncbi:putative glycosyl hydrolase-like family 6 (GHL6) protein [Kribbella sp. VKM Ac-2527]|uniref:Putative glycosyl hydrolase-like family 6 (GHL6) protein n=1 Tax=Kribbella caucasensis TaxID=2512215 RepID=A0A4R6KI29_9ACTN|nr:alpha-amylase family protein [Kribbella sp. VKM Ac-2527]TDO50674.1 putative glycosyl hydrolase-like family 6 (GHL6) protein [Kribbella sp. VKM Ac-2527]